MPSSAYAPETVQTVGGPLAAAALGPTLMHEHLLQISAEIAREYPELTWTESPEAVLAKVTAKLETARAAGLRTIVDVTTLGHNRDLGFVKAANAAVDINIVVATGYYTKLNLPPYFAYRPVTASRRRDVLTDLFVRDITEGIGGSGVRAAIIKCATDKAGLTPAVERVLRAAAVAHRETGVALTTHTDAASRTGLDQQRVFREERVDLSRVIIGHSGDSTDLDYLRELIAAGSMIGADRFGLIAPGMPTFDARVETVATLCAEGYADRIVLSHDYPMHIDWWDEGAPPIPIDPEWGLTLVPERVVPALRERGVSDADIQLMLIDNPRRILVAQDPY